MPTITPEVLWAQRSSTTDPDRNHIFLTLSVSDVSKESAKLDLQPTKLTFSGHSSTKNVDYAVELEFYGEIDPKESKIHHTDRDVELVLRKKELKSEYWPRLLKDSKKVHFVKTDFDKWVDEDEQDAIPEDDDYMNRMNAMGGGDGGFGGIDFSKLGGGAGGAGDFGGGDDVDESDGDEDMPELEGDETKAETKEEMPEQAEKKIEEV